MALARWPLESPDTFLALEAGRDLAMEPGLEAGRWGDMLPSLAASTGSPLGSTTSPRASLQQYIWLFTANLSYSILEDRVIVEAMVIGEVVVIVEVMVIVEVVLLVEAMVKRCPILTRVRTNEIKSLQDCY